MTIKQAVVSIANSAVTRSWNRYQGSIEAGAPQETRDSELATYNSCRAILEASLYLEDSHESMVEFAYFLGKQAFKRGTIRACAIDGFAKPLFLSTNCEVGNATVRDCLTAWLRGWDEGNLA